MQNCVRRQVNLPHFCFRLRLCIESDTGHNSASATRATRADSTVLQSDDLRGGVSVASEPDKHGAREYVSEKNGNDLADVDRSLQRRLRNTETTLISE